MVIKLLLLIVAAEALVNLFFRAAPLQRIRRFLIRWTPFLYSREQETHLLDCKYCVSVWIGFFVAGAYFLMENVVVFYAIVALAVGRMSNFLHLAFSYLADKQMDLRIKRGKDGHRS